MDSSQSVALCELLSEHRSSILDGWALLQQKFRRGGGARELALLPSWRTHAFHMQHNTAMILI